MTLNNIKHTHPNVLYLTPEKLTHESLTPQDEFPIKSPLEEGKKGSVLFNDALNTFNGYMSSERRRKQTKKKVL